MSRSTASSGLSQLDKVIAQSKRLTADLVSLRDDLKTYDPTSVRQRESGVMRQRLYLVSQQRYLLGDLIRDFEEAFTAAEDAMTQSKKLRLSDGKGGF